MKTTIISVTDTKTVDAKQLVILPAKIRAIVSDVEDDGMAAVFEWPRENVAAVLVEDTESQGR